MPFHIGPFHLKHKHRRRLQAAPGSHHHPMAAHPAFQQGMAMRAQIHQHFAQGGFPGGPTYGPHMWNQGQHPSQQQQFNNPNAGPGMNPGPEAGPTRRSRGAGHRSQGQNQRGGTQRGDGGITVLGGHHETINGYESDDPQLFHPRFGNMPPPSEEPEMPRQPRRSERHREEGGQHGGRGRGGNRFRGSRQGNPLSGWGEQDQNWAAPRHGGRGSQAPPGTVYEDDPMPRGRNGRSGRRGGPGF